MFRAGHKSATAHGANHTGQQQQQKKLSYVNDIDQVIRKQLQAILLAFRLCIDVHTGKHCSEPAQIILCPQFFRQQKQLQFFKSLELVDTAGRYIAAVQIKC